ncbi:tRNA (adenosine(37)-N6)-threonylcarbamoyltransferase complex dimerization subunit type 1 TsaB [Niveibacterium sp. SC-1]|uniref:tRNA (adenosine(37)-N6)-threonylcarbamoyltransferase complex dimerization subunit type 1 TsaB n=1 Tax=Niveibacterium sp. SC-1 TaxID=3135646 RepID=UPI00311DF8EB
MRILGLETSGQDASVALYLDGEVHETWVRGSAGAPASDQLLATVTSLLEAHAVARASLDAIAFSSGPGAFTGVRVACSVAQGLAVALDRPVVPVGTLEALAAEAGLGDIVCAQDARMGELYLGCYRIESAQALPVQVGELLCLPPSAVSACGFARWRGAGSGFSVGGQGLVAALGGEAIVIDAQASPRAAAVARLGALRCAAGGAIDPAEVVPVYVRNKVAKTTAERLAEGLKA